MKSNLIIAACLLGAQGAAAQDVRLVSDTARSALSEASLLRDLRDDEDAVPQDYIAAARADYRRLLTALYTAGYYGGTISIEIDGVEAAAIQPLSAPSHIDKVVIRVDAGSLFVFGDVQLQPVPEGTVLPEGLTPGADAVSGRIQSGVSAGIRSWRNLGYAKARVSDRAIIARHSAEKLDVSVTFDRGPRLTFGVLGVAGNKRVRSDRIREIAGLPTGDVYSPDDVDNATTRLRRTGAFDSVSLTELDDIGAGDTVIVDAHVAESKRRRIGVGLELSSVEGLTASTYWLHRNLFGGAERLRIEGEVSGIEGETGGTDYVLGTNFVRPATYGPDTDLFLRGEVAHEDEPEYELDTVSIEVGFTRILSEDLTVETGIGVLTAREETELENREYTLLTFPSEATLDRRDDETDAKNGYYLNLEAMPFISLIGDINGARFYSDLRGYVSVGTAERLTFAARGQLGSVVGAGVDEAPADFLFYSGGGGTVRGQTYNSLGIDQVEDGETVTTGGTSFLGAQLEARYAVGKNLSLVGFYDVGQVGDTEIPGENGDWHAGAGFGVRYSTGIGPIRLDIATPASGDDVGEAIEVYIGIGQAF